MRLFAKPEFPIPAPAASLAVKAISSHAQAKHDHPEPRHGQSLFRKAPMRLLLLSVIFVLLGSTAFAQVAPIPFVRPQYFSNTGQPLAGGRLWSYQAGTTTNLSTFCDALGTITNPDPIILDAAGRPANVSSSNCGVFMGSNAYKFVLQTSLGQLIWTMDNLTANNLSLLASNNIWTGTNTWQNTSTFNGSTVFNVGFFSSGPNTLNGGGTLSGTWSGNPTFSGTVNFSGGFTATTGTFSGQIISTLADGTAPFVVASATKVINLDADFLDNCDWASPCAIGTTLPNTAIFTGLQATTGFQIGAGAVQTGTQGTDTKLLTSNNVSGTSQFLCTDGNGGATTSGCQPLPTQFQAFTYCPLGCSITGTPCTTGSSSFDSCTTTITWPTSFVNVGYVATCNGVGPVDPAHGPGTFGRVAFNGITTKTTNTVTVMISTQGSVPVSFDEIDCQGVQPHP